MVSASCEVVGSRSACYREADDLASKDIECICLAIQRNVPGEKRFFFRLTLEVDLSTIFRFQDLKMTGTCDQYEIPK